MTNIYALGFPKTGTTWLSRLLGDVLNSPVGASYKPLSHKCIATEGQDRKGDYYIGQGHQVPVQGGELSPLIPNYKRINLSALQDEKVILMTRDPRDVCVSAMYHWGLEDIHKTIKLVAQGKWPLTHGGGFSKFYKTWFDYQSYYLCVQYELLFQDTGIELRWILDNICGSCVSDVQMEKSIKRQSIEVKRKTIMLDLDDRPYGKEYQLNFLRKGIVGDWQNHFDDEAIRLSNHYFGKIMEEFGYV